MMQKLDLAKLKKIVKGVSNINEGKVVDYIPELTNVDESLTSISVRFSDSYEVISACSSSECPFITLQSISKIIPLVALLEEVGPKKVYSWVKVEPSGQDFASVARLDQFGPKPSNPMLNAGAITLSSQIVANISNPYDWTEKWVHKLFGKISINEEVLSSELKTANRNRALAYLLKSRGNIPGDVEEAIRLYSTLCSYQANVEQVSYLGALLANNGKDASGKQIFSRQTSREAIAIMATCGLYNETGRHMLLAGIPAKSSVSGYILGVVPGIAGVAVLSPKVNSKGNSLRGVAMLHQLSNEMDWHFASCHDFRRR